MDSTEAERSIAATESKFEKLGGKLSDIGGKITGFGKSLSLKVTAPIVAIGSAAVKMSMDQETAFAKVSTLLTGSSADYEKYKKDIRSASSEMGVAFEDYAESVYSSISAGQDQADAIEFTRKAVKLAGGGFTETSKAVDVMTTALNAYGLSSDKATSISDMLITTQNLGKTTVDELASSMGAVIPVAQAQNVSFDQLSAGYAALTKNGIATAQTGTYMKAMFTELGKSGSKVDKILRQETGKSFSELQAEGKNVGDVLQILNRHAEQSGLKLSDLFGSVQAGSAALVLAKDGGAEYQEMLKAMGDSAGATEEAFNKMADTSGDKVQIAVTKIKNAIASLGDVILPIVGDIAEKVGNLVTKFDDMSPATQKTIVVIAGIAAAIGPVLIVIGTLISSIGSIVKVIAPVVAAVTEMGGMIGLLTNPIGLAVAAIVAIVAALVLAYNKVEWFRNVVDTAWNQIKSFTEAAFKAISDTISKIVKDVVDFVKSLLDKFKDFWKENGDFILQIVKKYTDDTLSTIKMVMGLIKGVFEIVWPIISNVVKVAWEYIKLIVKNTIDIVLGIIQTGMKLMQGDWKGAWESIKNTAQNIWRNVEQFFKNINLVQIGKDIIQGLINGIGSMASAVWDKAKSIADGVTKTIKGALKIASPSKVMFQLGKWTGEGLDDGLGSMINAISGTANDMAMAAIPNIAPVNASFGGQSGTMPSVQNISGGTAFGFAEQTIIVPVYLDGYEIARATYPHIDNMQGNNINSNNRYNGVR
ncbi:MAG TPA: phage tail tape measure protein [Bacillus bacterium]|nr:phage tail tape measure protein [Bacillus sp. (in: firmicutes)]